MTEDHNEKIIVVSGDVETRSVRINGRHLNPAKSRKVINHSPTGFAWGYGGSGPSQLALAILMEVLDETDAKRLYQQFKWDFVAVWASNRNFMQEINVSAWLEKVKRTSLLTLSGF